MSDVKLEISRPMDPAGSHTPIALLACKEHKSPEN